MKLLLLACFLIAPTSCDTATSEVRIGSAQDRPNLLILQTDEHNFRTLGCYRAILPPEQAFMWGQSVVTTPHIDSLAREGALCSSFYATSPVCCPSRAALVSGRYPQNTGVPANDDPMDEDIVTFAELLRREGYATGYAGKWHLEGKGKPQWAPPRKFGFEDNRYMFNRGHWKQLELTAAGPRVKAYDKKGKPSYSVKGADEISFATDFLTDRAIEFIDEHQDEPFCYFVGYPDPHGPDKVRPPYDEMFEDQEYEKPRTYDVKKKDAPSWGKPKGGFQKMAEYYGMVKCIDDNVGKILDALRERGLLEKTIVIFTADHGDLRGEHHRQNKGVPFEASALVPFVVRYPAKIEAGLVIDEALGCVDFLPTFMRLMEVAPGEDFEGRDASALFTEGKAPEGWKDLAFLRQAGSKKEGWLGVVTDRYKLIYGPEDEPWLFDLEVDPDELTNFFENPEYRETVRTLSRELRAYGERYQDPYAAHAHVAAGLAAAIDGGADDR